jgi:hypothetical protein
VFGVVLWKGRFLRGRGSLDVRKGSSFLWALVRTSPEIRLCFCCAFHGGRGRMVNL